MQNNPIPLSVRIEQLTPRLRTLASQFGQDAFEADDIFQEMVIAILTKADPADSNSRLLTRAKWVGLNFIKSEKTYGIYVGSEDEVAEVGVAVDGDDELADVFEVYIPDTLDNPERQLIENEKQFVMQVATDALNAKDQQIVRLLANNWNQSQIAEMLGVNRSVVSMRMKHIREVFAQSLTQASFAVAYA